MMPRSDDRSRRDGSHDQTARRAAVRSERAELLDHLTAAIEPAMAVLGLGFLVLLLVDYAGQGGAWVDTALQAIWGVFLVEFAARFVVAPEKLGFLRANWLGAISLVIPFLRPLRALQAARALRGLSLVRLLGGVNRGMRVLRRVTGGRRVAYVATLTVFIALAAAVGVLSFERGAEGATIETFGDALWWSTAMVTTINNEKYAVTLEGRIVAILLRIYALSIFGLITASIASYLIGREAVELATPGAPATGAHDPVAAEVAALRAEVAALRLDLGRGRPGGDPAGSSPEIGWTQPAADT